ncbi:MAG: hypothetical protein EXR99_01650 [Gemmataceae bacterium]|nr:hypothetical protein [Gemmataceae bacterium]
MGTTSFLLPSSLPQSRVQELENVFFTGGPDSMPFLTQKDISTSKLSLKKEEPDSGFLHAPWIVDGVGDLIFSTGTIMERGAPYDLHFELARGKVNQLRNYLADWAMGGLLIPEKIKDYALRACAEMGKAIATSNPLESDEHTGKALTISCQGTHLLMGEYTSQVLAIRHQGNQPIETGFTTRFTKLFPENLTEKIKSAFNHAQVNIPWGRIETSQGIYSWEEMDKLVDACLGLNIEVIGGPIISMSPETLPPWIGNVSGTPTGLATVMAQFIDATIRRYKRKIHRWVVCSGLNSVILKDFSDEILFRITCKLAEIAKQVNTSIETIIGITCPWGEYVSNQKRDFSPFTFADNLCRAGLNLAALDLEIHMGYSGAGNYTRDLMETSRLLDLFSFLGSPLTATIGYPSQSLGDTGFGGHYQSGKTPDGQGLWADVFLKLLFCKRFIQSVHWGHFQDSADSYYPYGGLVDSEGIPKPALEACARNRRDHLR